MSTQMNSKKLHLLFAGTVLMLFTACGKGGSVSVSVGTGTPDPTPVIDNPIFDPGSPVDTGGGDTSSSGDPSGCDASGCNSFSNHTGKDTDYQKAESQQHSLNQKAQVLANRFDMSFDSALQLSQLANQVKAMGVQGQLTESDRVAIAQSAFAIGGVTTDEVNNAVKQSMDGNNDDAEMLVARAAQKMEMSSASTLRDKILPAIGVKF